MDVGVTDAGNKFKPALALIAIYGSALEQIVNAPLTSVLARVYEEFLGQI